MLVHLSETLYDGNSKGQCEVFWESESTSMPFFFACYTMFKEFCIVKDSNHLPDGTWAFQV